MATRTPLIPPLADGAAPAPERTLQALVRTFGLLDRIMQPYFARFGISGAQWGVLRTIHRAEQESNGAGPRLTDLSDRLLVRPPSITSLVDRLERIGLVSRDCSREDLRAKQVSLTDKGRYLIEQVLEVHRTQIERLLSALTSSEQAELHRLLTRLDDHLERLADTGDMVELRPRKR